MLALSIRQPWAWLIIHAGKDIENREWSTPYTGPCLIHAGKTMTRADYEACDLFLRSDARLEAIRLPVFEGLQRGGIVGQVWAVGCMRESVSPWFCGPFGFLLSKPKALPFTPYKGRLGFFWVEEEELKS